MSVNPAVSDPHLDDGALLRLLDREGPAVEQAEHASHVATCDVCRQRHAVLAAWSRGASEVLARSDAAPRSFAFRRNGRPPLFLWRSWPVAAAVVLLVLGTVASGAPVRTWVAQRWAGLRRLLHVPEATRPIQTPTPTPSAPVGVVSFTPDSDVLVVRVATRQAEGSLVLETSATPTASAVVRGQGEHEAIVILPTELRITNTAASRATYRLTLPSRLKRVDVVIDSDPAIAVTPVATGESKAIDLRMSARH
jgi:hypothetical protein